MDLKSSKLVTSGTRQDMAGDGVTEALITALQKWWDEGENTSFLAGKKILSSKKIPNLPENESFVTLTWDLSELDLNLKETKFTIDIQKKNGVYRLKNPSFFQTGVNQAIEVQGLYVVMNGVWSMTSNNYAEVKTIASDFSSSDGKTVLSSSYQMVLDSNKVSDEIAFAFGTLKPSQIKAAPANQPKILNPSTTSQTQSHQNNSNNKKLLAFDENKVQKAAHFIQITAPVIFQMGSPPNVGGPYGKEDLHWVKLTHSFEMQATLVTQLQWYLVMKTTPSYFKDQCDEGSTPLPEEKLPSMCKHHPVEQVSWNDIQEFISKLNEAQGLDCGDTKTKEGFIKAQNTPGCYRLPSESEWEYVAHGGLPPEYAYAFGNEFDGQYAWYDGNSKIGNRNRSTHAVATKLPTVSPQNENDFLYDMAGNVWEWAQDWYSDYPKAPDLKSAVVDPQGTESGSGRVLRGGGWYSGPEYLRSARRINYGAGFRYYFIGFRLVRTSP